MNRFLMLVAPMVLLFSAGMCSKTAKEERAPRPVMSTPNPYPEHPEPPSEVALKSREGRLRMLRKVEELREHRRR